LKLGRLPQWIWDGIVWAAHAGYMVGREVLLAVTFDPNRGYRLIVPPQVASPISVIYRPPTDAVLEIHSHGPHPAVFSTTDDRDEQGLRLYGVVGQLGTEQPSVSLRVGAYGYFLPIAWGSVFDGDLGAFRDAHFDSQHDDGAEGDGLSD
jgi:PRTRC genetic system protein A